MQLAELLDRQLALQRESYGKDPRKLEGDEFAEYVRNMALAAIVELAEFLQKCDWKPWRRKHGRPVARFAAVEELVDVQHFVLNLFLAMNVSAEELEHAYLDKMRVNAHRQVVENGG